DRGYGARRLYPARAKAHPRQGQQHQPIPPRRLDQGRPALRRRETATAGRARRGKKEDCRAQRKTEATGRQKRRVASAEECGVAQRREPPAFYICEQETVHSMGEEVAGS